MYADLTDIKLYLDITNERDDTLLTMLCGAARGAIESYCDRVFRADHDTTRTFDVRMAAAGPLLFLSSDLCAISSIVNGDAAHTTITPDAYHLLPHDPPHAALRLHDDVPDRWQGYVSITGRWAYSSEPPVAVLQAAREYVAYLYRSRDAAARPPYEPPPLPAHIAQLLAGYRRQR